MVRTYSGNMRLLLYGFLVVGLLAPSFGWSQTASPVQQVDKRLAEKQATAEAHRKQMETIKDPEQLTTAMRQHFQMTEEILALMLERRQLLATQGSTGAVPTPPASSPAASGMGGGMGGMMGHMGGMRQQEMGGMPGKMMQKEMGAMPGSAMQGGGKPGGMDSMSGSSMPSSDTQSAHTAPGSDMAQMMQRLTEHSAYMETLQDKTAVAQEMLRHQKMLDHMLQLMQ